MVQGHLRRCFSAADFKLGWRRQNFILSSTVRFSATYLSTSITFHLPFSIFDKPESLSGIIATFSLMISSNLFEDGLARMVT